MKVKIDSEEIDYPEKTTIMEYLKSQNKHIPGVCKLEEFDPYGSCRLCLVNVNGRMLPACATYPQENANIKTTGKEVIDSRRTALELMLSNHTGDCIGPCVEGCPADSDVQGYLALIANGKIHEAVGLMKQNYVLPAALGRVCPAFCEEECRRNYVDKPVAIRELKRYAADWDLEHGPWMPKIPESTGKKIAIIGGGPAGLSCAYYLRTKGHEVEIFEAMQKLGGMLRYGIPKYRLPKDVLDKDIATIIDTGIKVHTNTRVGNDISFNKLQKKFDAVFLAIGSWEPVRIRYEGCELPGVLDAIEFLREINMGKEVDIGENILVVGGGNSAMDVARTANRLGANVTVAYRRSRKEMPADEREIIEAEEEGVEFMLLSNPVKILGTDCCEKVELIKMKLGEPDESGRCRPIACEGTNYSIKSDNVILAIGQKNDVEFMDKIGLKHDRGWLNYNKTTYQTNIDGLFVGGDVATGPSTVIESIDQGRKAAFMIDLYVHDKLEHSVEVFERPWEYLDELNTNEELFDLLMTLKPYKHWIKPTEEYYKDEERIPRVESHILPAYERKDNFKEVEKTLTREEAEKEVRRCMSCGCMDQFECKLREYATLYGAKQDTFIGEKNDNPIDESHPHIRLDTNKCILCGQCINLTHEITGEGIIDNLNRGFITKNGPPVGMKLEDTEGQFYGNFVDDCPTGAFSFKYPFVKDGPWDAEQYKTICNGCGMGCEMIVEIYRGLPVTVRAFDDSWNHGLVCDIPRFTRLWENKILKPLKKENGKFTEISFKDAEKIVKKHTKNLAIILSGDITDDEIKEIEKFAKKKNFSLYTTAQEGISTTKFASIFRSKRIKVDVPLDKYPVLKPFINIAKKQGAIITDKNSDIAILEAPAEPEDIPTIIMHEGVNEVGHLEYGLKQPPTKNPNYLIIGASEKEYDGFTMSLGMNPNADLILPMPSWISRSGKVHTSEKRELQVKAIT
ncbi:MAG: FAD-dependent oxidoreductase, partial [Asgard group archaeon]|nr:FAD-dependent oxidoreductase [Asgard group archaeon]